MRFVFLGSELCLQLPSHPASRRRSCLRLDVPDGGYGLVQPHVLSWRLSNTLDGQFCLEALEEALACRTPEIFNTDQGVQYTATAFTARLELTGVAISMDGRGRWMDNVFVERLWRTVKYECLYLHDFATVRALEAGLAGFFQFYNDERLCGLGLPHAGDDVRGGMRHPTKSLPWSKSRRFFSEKIGRIFRVRLVGERLCGRAKPLGGLTGRWSPPSKKS